MLACGERMWEEEWGRCREVCLGVGPNANTLPHISSLPSPFPTSPLTCFTPQHTFLHLLLIPLPTSPLPRPTSQHIFLLSPHLPTPSQSVAKLPCDKVPPTHPNTFFYYPHISPHLLKVWRSYHVTKFVWQSYHVAKLLATHQTSKSQNQAAVQCMGAVIVICTFFS